MKKTILKDDHGKSLEVDLKEFLDHLNEYHKTGMSTHTQSGCSFTVNDEFRNQIQKLYEQKYFNSLWLFIGFRFSCSIYFSSI